MGTMTGSEDLLASILSYSWIKCTCLPLCSQVLAEEKRYFPSRQRHWRSCSFYCLPGILNSTWRSITSFGHSNLRHPQNCNGQFSRLPNPSWSSCSLRVQSLVHHWKGKETSGSLLTKWQCSYYSWHMFMWHTIKQVWKSSSANLSQVRHFLIQQRKGPEHPWLLSKEERFSGRAQHAKPRLQHLLHFDDTKGRSQSPRVTRIIRGKSHSVHLEILYRSGQMLRGTS